MLVRCGDKQTWQNVYGAVSEFQSNWIRWCIEITALSLSQWTDSKYGMVTPNSLFSPSLCVCCGSFVIVIVCVLQFTSNRIECKLIQCIQNCVCFMERTTDGNKLSAKFGLSIFFLSFHNGWCKAKCQSLTWQWATDSPLESAAEHSM